jgi:hypothetical protein
MAKTSANFVSDPDPTLRKSMRLGKLVTSASSALVTAGICALVFGASFILILVATLILVGGDGTAPWITHMSVAVIEFTVKLLGFPRQGNLSVVAAFWASIVFLLVFVILLPLKLAAGSAGQNVVDRRQGYSALVFVLAFVAVPFLIYGSLNKEKGVIEEEQLALDYVTHNSQVMEMAGGPVKAFRSLSVTYSYDRNRARYEFSIVGPKKFYAVVDVNRESGKPEFRLACVTTLSMGNREAGKDPCTQSTIPLPE